MDINGVQEVTASPAGYGNHPPPASKPLQKIAAQASVAAAVVEEQQVISKERIQKMAEDIQQNLSQLDVNLKFSTYGKNDEQISIVVTEKETGKVIREIPSKELQALYSKMQELVGMVLNKTV